MNSLPSPASTALMRPDSADLADAATGWKSAYVHIPFCLRRCPYCDFAIVDESLEGRAGVERYVDAVLSEIGMEQGIGPLDAINFGGGTPTRLTPEQLISIVESLESRFSTSDDVEVSLEANPEDWTDEMANRLVEGGFTRLSIGAQSFDDAVLAALGRNHEADDIAATVESARAAGFRSVSIDLIFGHPAESDESWRSSVERALALEPDHVSTYSLTVEPGTQLSREVRSGAPEPDDDTQADRYEFFLEKAEAAGIVRYEVSNHARVGHACRYNLSTWGNGEYLAFGLGAHDHVGGVRSRNHRRIDRYLEAVEAGERPRLGSETLDAAATERDTLMLGLRLACGVAVTDTVASFVASQEGKRLIDAGVMGLSGGRLIVRKPMLTDAVVREALSVSAIDC